MFFSCRQEQMTRVTLFKRLCPIPRSKASVLQSTWDPSARARLWKKIGPGWPRPSIAGPDPGQDWPLSVLYCGFWSQTHTFPSHPVQWSGCPRLCVQKLEVVVRNRPHRSGSLLFLKKRQGVGLSSWDWGVLSVLARGPSHSYLTLPTPYLLELPRAQASHEEEARQSGGSLGLCSGWSGKKSQEG